MDHISCSQMNLYLNCSLKYKFNYIDKLPKPFKSSGLAFGSSLHAALAWLHENRMRGNDVPVDKLYKIYNADWYAQKLNTEISYKDGENEARLSIMAKELLSLYYVKPQVKPKGAEVAFTIPLVNKETGETLDVPLEGFIDLIENDNTITEFKTSAQKMNGDTVNDHLQLTAYSYAYEVLYNRQPTRLKIVDFVKTKKPKIITLQTEVDKLDYQRFFHLASGIIKGIKSGVFFPKKSFMCKDCEFSEPCKSWKGN